MVGSSVSSYEIVGPLGMRVGYRVPDSQAKTIAVEVSDPQATDRRKGSNHERTVNC